MSTSTKHELVRTYRRRYRLSTRAYKSLLLDELCRVTGYERKHAIKLMAGQVGRGEGRSGRPPTYDSAVVEVLHGLWMSMDQMCGKRFVAAVPLWLPAWEQREGRLSSDLRSKVLSVSASQADRLLRPYRVDVDLLRGRGSGNAKLMRETPLRCGGWTADEQRPGYLEVDSVAHCGDSMSGNFAWSLTYTDSFSGWTEQRATWNRGQRGVLEQTRDVEQCLPFDLLGFDSDNGGEFMNETLQTYLRERARPIHVTRSRPYVKNDNAHVEQKNYTHVRQLLGYGRLADPARVEVINQLYRAAWCPLQNFYCPSMRLVGKERINGRVRKRHDTPQTPCERLLAWDGLQGDHRERLEDQRRSLDPLQLSEQVEMWLGKILK